MQKQFHIKIKGKEELVIDLIEDEGVSIQVDNQPTKFDTKAPKNTTIKVTGLRWRDSKHFHLGWLSSELKLGDELSIKLVESERKTSPLSKEEEYIESEAECSFCHKLKSQVECLVEKDFMARICNECVDVAVKAIEDRRNQQS